MAGEAAAPVISALSLAHSATLALRAHRPRVSSVNFAFLLSRRARLTVTLAFRVSAHGHAHWQTLTDTLNVTAGEGFDHEHLTARGHLAAGLYLLTVSPAYGIARSITLRAG